MRRPRGFSPYDRSRMRLPAGVWRAWLGREPEVRASLGYRALLRIARLLLLLSGNRLERVDAAALPDGPCVIAGGPHRTYFDALLVACALPPAPRVWGAGIATDTSAHPLLGPLLRRTGGIIPFVRGGGFDLVEEAARTVTSAGGRFAMMPEGGIAGPEGRCAEFRPGAALLAHRLGVPLVPLALIRRRRRLGAAWSVVVLSPEPRAAMTGALPGSREEMAGARAAVERCAARIDALLRR
jgi:hypothetical protein